MRSRNILAVFLVLFSCFAVKAEVIDGPANFRIEPNGPILFSLKDGQQVECGLLKNGWYKVSIDIGITDQQFKNSYEVKKGDKLIDFNGKLICVALLDISFTTVRSSSGDMEIFGYVSKSNIKHSSIPENTLDSVFSANKLRLQYISFRGFIIQEKFRKGNLKTLPGITQYYISESTVIDPSPIYRIALYFEKNELIAIEHSRSIHIGNFKEYTVFEKNKLLIIKPPAGLSDRAFVGKVQEAYAGAD